MLLTFNVLFVSLQGILEFSLKRGNESMLEKEVMEYDSWSVFVCCVSVLIYVYVCGYACFVCRYM